MARSFLGIPVSNYQGSYIPFTAKIYGRTTYLVPLNIDWANYNAATAAPNQIIVANFTGNGQSVVIPFIASVKIDNSGSNVPIYVFAPDTKDCVVAAPNSIGWYPILTNGYVLWITGEGFTDGFIPLTTIIASSEYFPPASDLEISTSVALWKASPSITRGNTILNQNYGTPALGDITRQYYLTMLALGGVNIFDGVMPNGFWYLTGIDVSGVAIENLAPGGGIAELFIRSTGSAGVLYDLQYFFSSSGNPSLPTGVQNIFTQTGLQIKLDATQQWQFYNNSVLSQGEARLIINYSYNNLP